MEIKVQKLHPKLSTFNIKLVAIITRLLTRFLIFDKMFKQLKELYRQYKAYVRVDLVMYGVMILLIILYFIYSVVF